MTVNAPMEHPKQLAEMRDLSAQLTERLREAPAGGMSAARLGVRIGNRGFLVDMTNVGEVVPTASITRVPWTRPWFRGLANVRGRLVGVYDLLQMGGAEPLRDEQGLQLLVLGDTLKVNAALLVSRAFGLRYAKDLDPVPATDEGKAAAPWEGARFRDAGGTTLTELNLARLVADERFASIGI
jgi:twitching motility protein PilI